ncbi:MAG TPA: (2Fe-2S)-binding protein [Nocardioides sp.]|jgi:aerobic-type carbon monoxide dehydrogenase small subunit (CoxS/CutS family)|nr:(2Fe-2S)-binding protein [Nocardioides sp.]
MTSLTVNGSRVEVDRPDDTPLLTVLRDALSLVGSRFGCGQGLCGACLVLLDGRPVTSCETPLWQAADATVVTVEGLAADGPNPVQQSLIKHQAAQCGFCISGIVVRATALLEETPDPSAEEVAAALERQLCRCGTHQRIVEAVLAARTGSA